MGLFGDKFGHLVGQKVAVLVLDFRYFMLNVFDLLAKVFAQVECELFVVKFGE